jgi:hypothetical protein
MREKLKAALLRHSPDMKDRIADRCVDHYVAAVMQEIATQFALMSRDDFSAGETNFRAEHVMHACGQVQSGGARTRVWSRMQSHNETSLVISAYRGNSFSGRISRVTLNPKYKKDIMDELKSLAIELDPSHLQDLEERANWDVVVAPDALQSYITHTRRALDAGDHGEHYQAKLTRALCIANALKSRIKSLPDGTHYISEYWEEIDSGRVYGHGLSLQRVPREVRHAALGPCHKYDFKASSYALMTSLALQIDPTLQVEAIRYYVKHRSHVRRRIAKQVGISDEWAKSVFTALGFGAELKDTPFNAIRKQLGKEKYDLLMGNDEFAAIASQFKAVCKTLASAFSSNGFELCGRTYSPTNPKTGRKRTPNQKLAWIYQCLESAALQTFLDAAAAAPLLAAHDCLYFKHEIPASLTADIAHLLSQRFELLRFEHEPIFPIHATEDLLPRDWHILEEDLAHRALIAAQERAAISYTSPHLADHIDAPRYALTPWGRIEVGSWMERQTSITDSW